MYSFTHCYFNVHEHRDVEEGKESEIQARSSECLLKVAFKKVTKTPCGKDRERRQREGNGSMPPGKECVTGQSARNVQTELAEEGHRRPKCSELGGKWNVMRVD